MFDSNAGRVVVAVDYFAVGRARRLVGHDRWQRVLAVDPILIQHVRLEMFEERLDLLAEYLRRGLVFATHKYHYSLVL